MYPLTTQYLANNREYKWQKMEQVWCECLCRPSQTDSCVLLCAVYYNRSFLYTQRIISHALIRQWEPGAAPSLGAASWNIQRIPYPQYIDDAMVQVLQQNFPVVLMLSFILSVIIMAKNIVYEKERQLKVSRAVVCRCWCRCTPVTIVLINTCTVGWWENTFFSETMFFQISVLVRLHQFVLVK